MGHRATGLALFVGWACLLGGVLHLLRGAEARRPQGDLLAYHAAGRALSDGLSPYDEETLEGRGASTPFVYPPLAWPFARLVGAFEWPAVARFFLGLKVLGLLALALVWRHWLRARPLDFAVTLGLGLIGFRLAVRVDLITGNVALFESLGLWTGIVLATRRPGLVPLPLGVAAQWKLVPLSALPVVLRRVSDVRAAVPGLLGLAVVVVVSVATEPAGWRRFLEVVTSLDEGAPQNATVWVLMNELSGSRLVAGVLWLCFVALVVSLTLRRRHRPTGEWVPLALLAWALVLPRFKDYSYVSLLPAAAVALRVALRRWWPLAGLLLVLHAVPLHPYQRLATALLSWLVLLGPSGNDLRPGLRDATASR